MTTRSEKTEYGLVVKRGSHTEAERLRRPNMPVHATALLSICPVDVPMLESTSAVERRAVLGEFLGLALLADEAASVFAAGAAGSARPAMTPGVGSSETSLAALLPLILRIL